MWDKLQDVCICQRVGKQTRKKKNNPKTQPKNLLQNYSDATSNYETQAKKKKKEKSGMMLFFRLLSSVVCGSKYLETVW